MLQEFIIEDDIFMKYNGYKEDIVLPNGIKEIEQDAFRESYVLNSIVIPEGVKVIGNCAFYFCDKLNEVFLPTSLQRIEKRAFGCCHSLTYIELPQNVSDIGFGAFMDCLSLERISVHPDNSFYYSEDGALFEKKDGKKVLVVCPGGVEGIYTIPEGTTAIRDYAFYGCKKITGVVIPESVVEIGESAFVATEALKKIDFPNKFLGCIKEDFAKRSNNGELWKTKEKRPTKTSRKKYFTTAEEILEWDRKNKAKLQEDLAKKQAEYWAVSEGEKEIRPFAFNGCENLKEVYIPDGVRQIGREAFWGCKNLRKIRIPDSVTHIGQLAFDKCDSLSIIVGKGVLDEDPLVPIVRSPQFGTYSTRNTRTSIFRDTVDIKVVAFPKMKLRPYNYPIKWLMSLALGFLAYPELYDSIEFECVDNKECRSNREYVEKVDNTHYMSYMEYVRRYERTLLTYIFENDIPECLKFFVEYKGMTTKNFKTKFLEKAKKLGAVKCKKYILRVDVTAEKEKKALKEIKKRSCESLKFEMLRRDWTYTVHYYDDGDALSLTYYLGSEDEVIVPERIDGRAVEELSCTLLSTDYSRTIKSITIPKSVIKIDDSTFSNHKHIMIRGYKNSYAKYYALKNGITFEEIEEEKQEKVD